MVQGTKTNSSSPQPTQPVTGVWHSRKRLLVFSIVLAGVLLVSSIGAGLVWYFQDRALPSVTLASVEVGGKTRAEITQIVQNQVATMKVTFTNGQTHTATLSELGVNVDVGKSVQQALNTRRDIVYNLDLWQQRSLPLTYTADIGVFKNYIKEHFPSVVVDAKDAQLVFNPSTQKFEIQPGEPGKGYDLVQFTSAIEKLVAHPQPLTLPVSTSPVQPLIRPTAFTKLQQEVNQQVGASLRFTYQGKLIYSASPQDIASWTNFTPDPVKGTVTAAYDPAKIKQFLSQKVGANIAAPAIDRKVIHDPTTGNDTVIQQGQVGRQLDDLDGLAKRVTDSLANNQPLNTEVAITTAPFKTINLAGTGRWIEVDLSEQRTYLWLDNTKIASFLISSGVSWAPTVKGEFAIRHKTPNQVMTGGSKATGDYYYLPNVKWDSYFYEDYAFHAAYWHNNFGHPMSHGCINMREADAKQLYDFAPIGTKVVVHA